MDYPIHLFYSEKYFNLLTFKIHALHLKFNFLLLFSRLLHLQFQNVYIKAVETFEKLLNSFFFKLKAC